MPGPSRPLVAQNKCGRSIIRVIRGCLFRRAENLFALRNGVLGAGLPTPPRVGPKVSRF